MMEPVYQEPRWIARFTLVERTRGRSTDEPEKCGECGSEKPFSGCRHCGNKIKFSYRALCRGCELTFGDFLIEDWPRCAGCFFPFGNGLDHGYWVTQITSNLCGYCDWVRQGYSIEKMLETIAHQMGRRFVARIELQLKRSRHEAIRYVADGMWHHRTLIEMLKHVRCTVQQATAVFLRIAESIVAAVADEEIEIDAIASRDGWRRDDEARPGCVTN